MVPTEAQLRKLRLLSDLKLYNRAISFMQRFGRSIPTSQLTHINGLLNITKVGGYYDVLDFMEKKKTRAWPEKSRYMKNFYTNLAEELEEIKQLTEQEFHSLTSITQGKAAQEAISLQEREQRGNTTQKDELDGLLLLMIRDFIQHLAAENGYRRVMQQHNG